MRAVGLVLVLTACTEEGAHLTFRAPDGPNTAATYQLVLASPDMVPMIDAQRVTPTGLWTETVSYYLQSTEVAATGSLDRVEGFTVLVAPSSGTNDTAFIPFVALYDHSGTLVGMGTFRTSDGGPPAPILVKRTEVDRYTLDVEPVQEVDDSMPVQAGQALRVDCTHSDQSTFDSGLAWRPHAGGELRILLADGDGGDATGRPLDMDCDGHVVSPTDATPDCDDTRARFHEGATEACDGEDTNCDGAPAFVVACTAAPGQQLCTNAQSQGVALCDDTTGTVGACQSDPQCTCATNTTGCNRCVLQHETATPQSGFVEPCQPGIGQLSSGGHCDGGSPCIVRVLGVQGGWAVTIAANSQAPFASFAAAVGASFAIKAERPEGPGTQIMGALGHSVGEVDLDIIDVMGVHHYEGVELEMDSVDSVCPAAGTYSMACSP
jgi:hypothetical protein